MRARPSINSALGSGPAIVALLASLLGGCDSIGEGLDSIASSLTPTTPGEAARLALDQNDPDKRREGIVLLSNAHFGGDPVYVELYREYTRFDADPMVRAVAIAALARFGEPADALYIAPHLDDETMQVRWEAAKGLQRLHNPEVVPALVTTLSDDGEHADVRSAAAIALGQYPQDTVFQVLVLALDTRELSINLAAQHSLRTLTGQDLGLDARDWLAWHDEAEDDGVVFADRQEYFYPTYSRDLSWIEELAFWAKPTFEPPGQPAGMTPKGQRSTYEDEGDLDGEATPSEAESAGS